MQHILFLGSKERKKISKQLVKQFGSVLPDCNMVLSGKDKLYLFTGSVSASDLSRLRVSSAGIYFGRLTPEGLRLSIEGSQIVSATATKNLVPVDASACLSWLSGEDIQINLKDCKNDIPCFVILMYDTQAIGCAKFRNGTALNYVSKTRRISEAIDLPITL